MSDIITLSTGERITDIKPSPVPYCDINCDSVLVDAHLRVLTCRKCGKVIDPFMWAARMAMEESRLLDRIRHLRVETSDHAAKVDALKQEEGRVKARIRSAKDSLLKSAGV